MIEMLTLIVNDYNDDNDFYEPGRSFLWHHLLRRHWPEFGLCAASGHTCTWGNSMDL